LVETIILVGVCAFFLIRVFEFGIYAKVLVYNLRLIVRKITDEKNECCCSPVSRSRIGDWEVDLVIGKGHKGGFATLAKRKSRLYLALPIANKSAQAANDAITTLLVPIKHWVKTLTFDNGREFSWHNKLAETLSCCTYFAKPYHSWERGLNENHNGALRQFFPKQMALDKVNEKEVFKATDLMNNRPRKCLGYKTPFEVFAELTGKDYFLN
jgi:IS30 family transposase